MTDMRVAIQQEDARSSEGCQTSTVTPERLANIVIIPDSHIVNDGR